MKLRDQTILILDCQTTGASPAYGKILELGWATARAIDSDLQPQSSLLTQEDGIPRRIQQITGICEEDLHLASEGRDVWASLLNQMEELSQPALGVIHYSRFEIPFLKEIHPEEELPFFPLCTYEIARRLFPDLPSRSIRAVSGFLGHPLGELKRAAHHVQATFYIWSELVRELEEKEKISTFSDLKTWISNTKPQKKGTKQFALKKEIRLDLPSEPGIYLLKGAGGKVLYVGKATSLKSRVNSYFRGQKTKGQRLNELISQVMDVETEITGSPLEAALRENDLIKSLSPPYNRALKEGNREILYSDRQLRRLDSIQPGCIGPFTRPRRFVELDTLFEIQNLEMISELLSPEMLPLEVIVKGFEVFKARYGVPFSRNALRHLLCCTWRERILRERERLRQLELRKSQLIETDEEEALLPEDEEERPWEPEDFSRYLASILGGTAMRIFRSRWLLRLMDSKVHWKKGSKASRKILIQKGQVVKRFRKSGFSRLIHMKEMDLITYDRMNILLTEILLLIRKGNLVQIEFRDNGSHLSNREIQKYIFPEYFDG